MLLKKASIEPTRDDMHLYILSISFRMGKLYQHDQQNCLEKEISSLLAISSISSLPPTISAPAAFASSASAPSAKTATVTAWKIWIVR